MLRMLMNRFSIIAVLFFAVFLAFLFQMTLTVLSLTEDFSPDTYGFVEFSPYRQPLYGLWMISMHKLLGSWELVKSLQIVVFCIISGLLALEMYLSSKQGRLAAIGLILVLMALSHYGAINYVGSLISEGLFYSLLLMMAWLLMRWFRLEKVSNLIALVFLCVLTSQLKTTFLPVLALIVVILISLWLWSLRTSGGVKKSNQLVLITTLLISISLLPSILGKNVFQLSTEKNRLGFVILPRIGLLPTPPQMTGLHDWEEMSSSWRDASEQLSILPFTQFDAQLQEAIRYHIYPVKITSVLNQQSVEAARIQWQNGEGFEQASQLAFEWIQHSPQTYLSHSFKHLVGLLLAAPLMVQTEKDQVLAAFNQLSPETWEIVGFRKDYPLGDLTIKASHVTNLFYITIRLAVALYLLFAVASLLRVAHSFWSKKKCGRADIALVISLSLIMSISLAPAFTVFPEIRYVYANLLIIFPTMLMYVCLFGSDYERKRSVCFSMR